MRSQAAGTKLWPPAGRQLSKCKRADNMRRVVLQRPGPFDEFDAAALARELLALLYDVYGYKGSPKLAVATEKGGD